MIGCACEWRDPEKHDKGINMCGAHVMEARRFCAPEAAYEASRVLSGLRMLEPFIGPLYQIGWNAALEEVRKRISPSSAPSP